MYKKLATVLIIAVLLIISAGAISAADSDSISVKVTWDNVDVKPDHVTVNLIKDGQVVDTAKLNSENNWKTTFKVDDDGDYKVSEVISSDYSFNVVGNANSGFVINNKLVKEDVLGASDDEPVLEDDPIPTGDGSSNANSGQSAAGDDNPKTEENDAPATSDNGTGNSSDTNTTDNETSKDTSDDKSNDDSKKTKTTKTTTKTTTSKVVKKDKDNKKPENKTKSKKNNTGFPIAVLVLAVFAAAFVPFSRKK